MGQGGGKKPQWFLGFWLDPKGCGAMGASGGSVEGTDASPKVEKSMCLILTPLVPMENPSLTASLSPAPLRSRAGHSIDVHRPTAHQQGLGPVPTPRGPTGG